MLSGEAISLYCINQFMTHDLFGGVADIVHPSHPFHLILCFQGFRYTLLFRHLTDDPFLHIKGLLLDICQMLDQLTFRQQIIVEDLMLILQELPSKLRVHLQLNLRLLRQCQIRQIVVTLSRVCNLHSSTSKMMYPDHYIKSRQNQAKATMITR